MKQKKYIFLIIVLIISFSYGYLRHQNKALNAISNNIKPSPEEVHYFSAYTGEEVDKSTYDNISFMAIIENSKDARPQSGLSGADIVYETMAEGGIPRFIALFQKNNPSKIGPIRSARPYFLNISKEYSLPFAHCGYSDEAKAMIENEKLMSLNEFTYGKYYSRDTVRKAPHNLYTSAENLRKLITEKDYIKPSTVKLTFNKDFWASDSLLTANSVSLNLNKYYKTDYIYKEGKYYKSMDGKASTDKENNAPITAINIIIQITDIKLQKDNQHLDISLVGEGNGYVISNGKCTKMKWSKKNLTSQTAIKDENGLNIPLAPGNTWWHIIDKSNTVIIE
ncbi:DUF3048 domain-containing protein [Candidatus Clostridium radicumherbarum]|uniref:DUF3048 domain-containing protein n=1 Tax=Candidatus Clostridium radicumherbarum TaxID=3381662 RepID=A0ABW8TML7_9CLOT